MAKKGKFYVVWKGKKPGIFDSWAACKKSIANYAGAEYKSFESFDIAKKFGISLTYTCFNLEEYIANYKLI